MSGRLTPGMQQALRLASNSAPEARVVGGRAWMRPANALVQQGLCTLHRLNERKCFYEISLTEAGAAALAQMVETEEREGM